MNWPCVDPMTAGKRLQQTSVTLHLACVENGWIDVKLLHILML